MHAHLVFVTKYRHKVSADRHLTGLENVMRAVCADFEVELVEFNGENNHVHLLVNFPPKVTLCVYFNAPVVSHNRSSEFAPVCPQAPSLSTG